MRHRNHAVTFDRVNVQNRYKFFFPTHPITFFYIKTLPRYLHLKSDLKFERNQKWIIENKVIFITKGENPPCCLQVSQIQKFRAILSNEINSKASNSN